MARGDAHAYCLDCGRMIPDNVAEKDPFLQAGAAAPCRSCGGVIAIIYEEDAARVIQSSQEKRGLVEPKSDNNA